MQQAFALGQIILSHTISSNLPQNVAENAACDLVIMLHDSTKLQLA